MGIEHAKDAVTATFTLANGSVNPITPAMHLAARRIAGLIAARHPPLAVRNETDALRRSEHLDADDADALGSHLYRLQRLALGESDAQDSFLCKR